MYHETANRGEKLSTVKSAVVQYGILVMMLALAAGLVAAAGAGREQFPRAGRAEPHPQGPDPGRPRQALRPRKPARRRQLSFRLLLPGPRAKPQRRCRSAHDRAGPATSTWSSCAPRCATTGLSPGYQPIPIKQDITADEQAFIEAHRNELPELETIDEERRLYPRDGFAAHLIGYVGEVSEEDLNQAALCRLPARRRGRKGRRRRDLRPVAARARTVHATSSSTVTAARSASWARSTPNPASDLKLTIDLDLQRAAEVGPGRRQRRCGGDGPA